MKLNTLKPAKGSVRSNKRLGRGQGSGRGGTSTKGHKGAQSRSGYSRKIGFEGGQMPLQRRVPKFGFKRPQKVVFKPVNLDILQELIDKTKAKKVDIDLLANNGIVGKRDVVKILGRGELKTKVDVTAHKFSTSAVEAIEKLGGKVTTL
jgi:large subunit ribosomal protein L15